MVWVLSGLRLSDICGSDCEQMLRLRLRLPLLLVLVLRLVIILRTWNRGGR